jgi:hypothetical protein
MTKSPGEDDALKRALKTPPKPFTSKKEKPKASPKPPKARIQRHQGR